jgi:hypothetical protein
MNDKITINYEFGWAWKEEERGDLFQELLQYLLGGTGY